MASSASSSLYHSLLFKTLAIADDNDVEDTSGKGMLLESIQGLEKMEAASQSSLAEDAKASLCI